MRTLLMIIGALCVVAGLFFACQGAGIIPYPTTSFMVDNRQWIYYGVGIAVVGALVILLAWRSR
jgi:hypothetical protein